MDDVVDLSTRRSVSGTAHMTWCGQCVACGHQAMHVSPIPDWAAAPATPDCHRCGATRSVLVRCEYPETFNDGTAVPWTPE
jgi:hypothetical protein